MTLVQNHLQRLNGSKLILLIGLIAMSFFTTSCELFKKAQGDDDVTKTGDELDVIQGSKVYDPETGTYVIVEETPTEKMDTIRWRDLPSTSYPPITSDGEFVETEKGPVLLETGEYGSEFLSTYKVAMLLPFLTDQFNFTDPEINSKSLWAVNFYAGTKLAMDDLKDEGIDIDLTIIDSKASSSNTRRLLSREGSIKDANLIIGPYRRENVRLVAEFAKRNEITYVSPFNAGSELSENNPNYIQFNPTLKTHCEAITSHARASYETDQIVLVARNNPNELARFDYFHDKNWEIELAESNEEERKPDTTRFKEYIISQSSVDLDEVDMLPLMELQDTMVFIIPSWSDEKFVISFLRKLDLVNTEENHIVVYGMPQWMKYERVDYDYYEKLNVHISSGTFIDPFSTDIQFFRRKFFKAYGAPPRDEAYMGYDITLYCGRMLQKHGTKFQYWLDRELDRYMHTKFEFQQVVDPTTRGREKYQIDQFENKYVNILKFQDYQFQLAY